MIPVSCPTCQTPLEFADEFGSSDRVCYACRQPVKVPAAPVNTAPPEPLPPWLHSQPAPTLGSAEKWRPGVASGLPEAFDNSYRPLGRSNSYLTQQVVCAVALLLGLVVAALIALGMVNNSVWLFVDNGGEVPLVVTVDGKEAVSVPAGAVGKIVCLAGDRRIEVRRGDTLVHSDVKTLQSSSKPGVTRIYLLNPDKIKRYGWYTVSAGPDHLKAAAKFYEDRSPADRAAALWPTYRKFAEAVTLLAPEAWLDVPPGVDRFTADPDFDPTKSPPGAQTVLTRLTREEYEQLKTAKEVVLENKEPSSEDLKKLIELVGKIKGSS